MPRVPWSQFAKLKHQLSQERVIICGVVLDQKQSIKKSWATIKRLRRLDKRLERFENRLVRIILKNNGEQNGKN